MGLAVTGEGGLGYDQFTNEGKSDNIQARIIGNSVQLAIAYGALGIAESYFSNLIFEAIKGGLTGVGNYFWNDEYNLAQAGSPYDPSNRPENIYETDTLKATPSAVPVPASFLLFLSGLGILGVFGRLKKALTGAA